LQIHINGFVSLGSPPYPAWDPHFSNRSSVIAPFWTDIDLRSTDGVVYFNHILRYSAEEVVAPRDAEVFDAAKLLALSGAGDAGFLPTEVVTVTWQNVSLYPAELYSSQVHTVNAILLISLGDQLLPKQLCVILSFRISNPENSKHD